MHLSVRQINNRLEIDPELIIRQRTAQIIDKAQAVLRGDGFQFAVYLNGQIECGQSFGNQQVREMAILNAD